MLRFVLLGDPVAHSLSPRIHAAAMAAAGLVGTYEARRVDEAGFGGCMTELRRGDLDGANITMPHKLRAARAAEELSEGAERARSVNTMMVRNGALFGDSTDIAGIERAWGPLPTGPALILGSGGAAAAALLALEGRPLRVAGRRRAVAAELIRRTGVEASVIDWIGARAEDEVVVNATPIGMHGEGLPEKLLDGAAGLFDMPYGAGETPAVRAARELRIPAVDGSAMLLHQAARSFFLWTGIEPSLEAMQEALADDHSPESNR